MFSLREKDGWNRNEVRMEKPAFGSSGSNVIDFRSSGLYCDPTLLSFITLVYGKASLCGFRE